MDDITRTTPRRGLPSSSPKKEGDKPARGIDYSVIIKRVDGTPLMELPQPTFQQLWQLASTDSIEDMRNHLSGMMEKQTPVTLGKACEMALDYAIETDRNEGLRPKLKRGWLMEEISNSMKEGRELALESEYISLIKERIGKVYAQAYTVRQICLLLDPAMAGKKGDE